MRLFVSEYLCGGHWPESTWPDSLLAEGRAMIEAVIQDFLALPEVTVVTTWDRRLGHPSFFNHPKAQVEQVDSPTHAASALERFRLNVDAALVIAPEFEGLLEQQCWLMEENSISSLNCTSTAIQHCADKYAVFQTCRERQIHTVPTRLVNEMPECFPVVVKRRDGAGSLDMQLFSTQADWNSWRKTIVVKEFIEQPFVPGISCSLAAIFHQGKPRSFLPPTSQHLSDDGRFRYLGGTIPAPQLEPAPLHSVIEKFSQAVPGLQGYVGFDFLVHDPSGQPLLVDVNPRLCTSYVGYRALCQQNLAAWLIDPCRMPAPDFHGRVSFAADGTSRSVEQDVSVPEDQAV